MSLSVSLSEAIENIVGTFITNVSTQYNIKRKDLELLWTTFQKKEKVILSDDVDISAPVLLKSNKAELVALCKMKKLKCTGTKSELINRLSGKEEIIEIKEEKKKGKKEKKTDVKNTPVGKKLIASIPNIVIKRNKFNNYEHLDTGLIFNNDTKHVIGKQNPNGTIDDLTDDDIDQCNAFKFKYKLPKNLDHKSSLADVKIDELDDKDDDKDDDKEDDLEEDVLKEDFEEDGEEELLEDDDIFEDEIFDDE